jgi:hypothetical protein
MAKPTCMTDSGAKDWLKIKCMRPQKFVVGGYLPRSDAPTLADASWT